MHASLIKVPCVFYCLEKDAHIMTKDSPLLHKFLNEVIWIFGYKQAAPRNKNTNYPNVTNKGK